jgi:hypothetical protein
MDTKRLIETLAADGAYREPSVGRALAVALILTLPVAMAMLLVSLGLRPDISAAIRNPMFNLKFVVTLALVVSAIAVALHVARPEGSPARRGWLLLSPVALLALGIVGETLLVPQRAPMSTRLVGNNAGLCLVAIPLLSVPLLAAALIALRRGATSQPALLGALAGLAAAGLAATLYAAHCSDDSPLFVATWYSLATLGVAAVGAAAGTKILRY